MSISNLPSDAKTNINTKSGKPGKHVMQDIPENRKEKPQFDPFDEEDGELPAAPTWMENNTAPPPPPKPPTPPPPPEPIVPVELSVDANSNYQSNTDAPPPPAPPGPPPPPGPPGPPNPPN